MVLLLCLTLIAAGIVLEGIRALADTLGTEVTPGTRLMVGYLSLHVPGLILLHLFLRRHNRSWNNGFGIHWDRPFRVISMALIVTLIALGVGYSAQWLSGYLATLFNHEFPAQQAILLLREGSMAERYAIGFFAVILAPVVEEGLFRGVFYQWLRDREGMVAALIVSSLIFGLIHFNLMAFLSLTFFGAAMAWLYERTGNLLGCIVAHALFNLVGFLRAVPL
jgi:membrane protease YdiL (CAAX protease family)